MADNIAALVASDILRDAGNTLAGASELARWSDVSACRDAVEANIQAAEAMIAEARKALEDARG